MVRTLTRPRWTDLLGLLALVVGIAALVLAFGPGTSADGEQGPSARRGPAVCQGSPSQAPEGLRQERPSPGVKLRPTPPAFALSAARPCPKDQAPDWLCPSRARRTTFPKPSLQLLFCTWLA
jgi:hypothetical protein